MDWDDLRYVLAITRHRTLLRAADDLRVSHTTVGRRLRAVEARLGVRLFDRTPDGLVPTTAGQDIAEVAAETEQRVFALESRVLGQDERLRGELRVTTMDVFFIAFHEAFSAFAARYPDVGLTVSSSNKEMSLTRREADVALRMSDTPPDYLVGRRVGRVRFAPYASIELAKSIGPDAPLSDYPWLHWDERMPGVRQINTLLDQLAPGARVTMHTDFDSVLLREAVVAGVGVHVLSCLDGDAHPGLRRIGPVFEGIGRDLWLLTLPELRHTSRVRAFMDHMAAALAAHADALEGRAGSKSTTPLAEPAGEGRRSASRVD